MSGDHVRRLITTRQPGRTVSPDDDEDVIAPSFGVLRGMHERAIMLEVRHRDGRITALTYGWLDEAVFDPSEGITLHFGGKFVDIVGRNLAAEVRPNIRLFDARIRRRVSWVREVDEPEALAAAKDAVVIEQVTIRMGP